MAEDLTAPTLKIGFTCHEYMGSEIFRPSYADEPLTNESDIKVGDEVWVPAMASKGFYPMKVTEGAGDSFYAESGNLVVCLEFGKDDRKAWIASGFINTQGLERLGFK